MPSLGLTAGTASADRWVQTVYAEPTVYYAPATYAATSYVPTVYYAPTTYVPTTYYAATSYVPASSVVTTGATYYVPTSTSYVLPSSYATTAYTTLPTSYVTTSPQYVATTYYRRPGLLRRLASRPVIETSRTYSYDAFPTTTYLPTTITYDAPATTATSFASLCGETTVPFNPPQSANSTDASKTMTSTPENGGEPTYNEKAATEKAAAKTSPVKKPDPRDVPKDPVDPNATGAGGLNAPADDVPKSPTDTHTSFKPQYKDVRPREGNSALPVLRGEVVSVLSGTPKANMEVIFTDLKNTYADKKRKTDAKGAFEVYLPNGSWVVSVVDPAAGGKPREMIRITSTNGRYLDEEDAPLAGLRLNN